ncbi:DUF2058 domain-containing protein [Thiomicrorhabdus arctica]|jgi:hypothetical protein|uniref:DUF2058 domain-containing protein n=1 Tax=Thiomicrorhabdus arctica TaxID=131540 RepID=UPI00037B7F3F|nr:DUF2058 domain-containing protein [Thiomicrorhabdus arctica]
MAGSLFDQLKKAGLVDDKKAQKAKKEKYQQTKQSKGKKGQKPVVNEVTKIAEEAAKQKNERDLQLNLERKQQQEKKATLAELRQIIETNRMSGFEGDVVYNFADESTVKTLSVNKKIQRALVAGTIRLARFEGGYALIPIEAANKVDQRDHSVLISMAVVDESISQEDQDYYAQFEVPDDLIW